MSIDRSKLRSVYAQLKGLERATAGVLPLRGSIGRNYNDLVAQMSGVTSEDWSSLRLGAEGFYRSSGSDDFLHSEVFRSKLLQATSLLEEHYFVSKEVVEIGTLYNAIREEELRSRTADLLSAPANFDRPINQATLVLEDRIRKKSGDKSGWTGVQLINAVIRPKVAESKLMLSTDDQEQDGYANMMRGMMLAFRNPTHHSLVDSFTREDALKVVAFIDKLLRVIDTAKVR